MTQREVIQWHAYFDPDTWQQRIKNTPQGRAELIKNLILGASKNGKKNRSING